jgi:peptidoglycan/xylan/chitin deacetylase (PgdA/CDA1 family)
MKRQIKRAVQSAVSAAVPGLWKLRSAPSLLILMYHRVLPADHPQRAGEQPGMYVSPQTLAMHVEVLAEHFTLVHLDDWISAQEQGRAMPSLCCALTFDDGWRDNYEYAYPVLKRASVPATIYLVSDLVGTHYAFWPNRLAAILAAPVPEAVLAGLPEALRALVRNRDSADAAICACKERYTDAEMLEMLEHLERALQHPPADPGQRDLMDWNEIREIGADDLVRFGSHSRRHTRLLAKVPDNVIGDEISGSLAQIEGRLGRRPATFCYPNGDYSTVALAHVRKHYKAAVTTCHGWNSPAQDRYMLNRVGVHEDVSNTRASFLSRLAGVG